MEENLADLGLSAAAVDPGHQFAQRHAVAKPAARAALARPAVVEELDVEAAGPRRLIEHLGLQLTGNVPGRLPAHSGVKGEDKPTTATRIGRNLQPRQKRLHVLPR